MIILNTRRVQTIKGIPYKGKIYIRTREVAGVLEVKQHFEFTKTIKEVLNGAIVKGEATENFRCGDDTARTTFIEATELYKFLKIGRINHKFNRTSYERLVSELGGLISWKA